MGLVGREKSCLRELSFYMFVVTIAYYGVYIVAVRGRIVTTFLTDPFQLVQLYSVFPGILKGFLYIISSCQSGNALSREH